MRWETLDKLLNHLGEDEGRDALIWFLIAKMSDDPERVRVHFPAEWLYNGKEALYWMLTRSQRQIVDYIRITGEQWSEPLANYYRLTQHTIRDLFKRIEKKAPGLLAVEYRKSNETGGVRKMIAV